MRNLKFPESIQPRNILVEVDCNYPDGGGVRTEKSYKERQQLCGLSAWTLPAIGASGHRVIGKPVLHTSCPEHKRFIAKRSADVYTAAVNRRVAVVSMSS